MILAVQLVLLATFLVASTIEETIDHEEHTYTLKEREILEDEERSSGSEEIAEGTRDRGIWTKIEGTRLIAEPIYRSLKLDMAKEKCMELGADCQGISCTRGKKCHVVGSSSTRETRPEWDTYLKNDVSGKKDKKKKKKDKKKKKNDDDDEELECIEEGDAKGLEYRGTVSQTETGNTCAVWTDYESFYENYPDRGLGNHNYCRNPDEEDRGPWCINANRRSCCDPLWQYCEIPDC